ncbi:hypothetical protein DVH24_024218 [Malus domestica]|uniref:Uncharacterized protein n=1 Tax=Malus domestica TaxID=3750 RepID=A0A498JKS5_MALDO|nr:hypothetical protein DVH24_024218 [Malus domestica]
MRLEKRKELKEQTWKETSDKCRHIHSVNNEVLGHRGAREAGGGVVLDEPVTGVGGVPGEGDEDG